MRIVIEMNGMERAAVARATGDGRLAPSPTTQDLAAHVVGAIDGGAGPSAPPVPATIPGLATNGSAAITGALAVSAGPAPGGPAAPSVAEQDLDVPSAADEAD